MKKAAITNNIGTKILSLVCAILLWIFINGISDPVKTVTIKDIPVTITNEDTVHADNQIFEIKSGKSVSIRVRGKSTIVDNLTANDFKATADFINMYKMKAVPIDIVTTYSDNDIEILDKNPLNMVLELEDADTKSFRVTVETTGTVAEGYYIVDSSASPNIISISGSKTAIGSISKIAAGVSVDGTNESFNMVSEPVAYDSEGNKVDSSKLIWGVSEVIVAVNILPVKEIKVNVTVEGEPNTNYYCSELEYDPKTIMIAGKQSDLDKIDSLEFVVDTTDAVKDIETEINISDEIEKMYGSKYMIVENEVKTLMIRASIMRKSTVDITIPTSQIEVKNLAPNMISSFSNDLITVRLIGKKEDLNDITAEKIKLYIDTEIYQTEGTYRVTVNMVELPKVTMRSTITTVTFSEAGDEL